ncbi:MAG: AEC family transporter [Selenomonas noxia]|jgi:auxin efflux carrier|uniref:AEC family transporter n=1 Tax=Selenomonas noxia TaxID=135083 RepID=UPI001CB4C05F|nr:transporter [Selenomonas noxia]MBF1661958.1 transporter [Selenomonas noxia]
MNEINARLIYLGTDLILPLIVGYLLYQRRLLSDAAVNLLIRINVVVFFTLLSLFSFWALPLTRDLVILPAFFAFIILFPGFISWRFLGRRFHSPIDRGTHLISALLSNIGTLGGICAYIIYGEPGFAYAQIGGACQNLILVLLAFPAAQYYYLLHKNRGRSARLDGRAFLGLLISWNQLSLLGMAAGLLLNLFGAVRPPVLSSAFSYLIHISAWFAMLPVGSLINFRRARHFVYLTLDMIFLRFLLVPLVAYFAARLVISDPVIRNALVLFAGVPAAINATLTARLYHLNVDYTIAVFLVTTVLYLTVLFPAVFFLFR